MAVNSKANVELYDNDTLVANGVGSVTELVTLAEGEQEHTYRVKVSLDEETYSEYTLELTRTSSDTSLKLVEVNDVVRNPTPADKYIYEVGIPEKAETAKIKVQATNSHATVQIGDYEPVKSGNMVTISLNLNESRITVPVVVTAVDGTTIDTFNIILLRKSSNVTLESLKVNGNELEAVDDVYTYYMEADETNAHTEVTTVDNATIEVDENTGVGHIEFDETFGEDTIKVEKKIKVTSEDETIVKEYTLILIKKTQIKGTITTENFDGKHKSKVSLYQAGATGETVDSVGTEDKKAIATVETKEDGSFEIDIEKVGTYDIVVTKPGYLSYKVKNIEVKPGDIITLDTYKLKAGDVIETGQIELDDLIAMNEMINAKDGTTITEENKEIKGIYDLNEDGVIDSQDRTILKKNYSKKSEEKEWVKPVVGSKKSVRKAVAEDNNEVAEFVTTEKGETDMPANEIEMQERPKETATRKEGEATKFVLPIVGKYTITSDYGMRVHPITGKESKHTGIDISGEWHTEILAVADGEVTKAGANEGSGNYIEIKHIVDGEEVYSFYAHLSRKDVKVGDKVKQGEVIGLEGGASSDPNHGISTGHHLHFEIRNASGYGNDVDPNKYIKF